MNLQTTWPELHQDAYYGLIGRIVRAIEPHTEADPVGILVQLLIGFGNAVGRNPHYVIEAIKHYPNLFGVIVGRTALARKGTSWGHSQRILAAGEPYWADKRILSGLSSGEGLVSAVRDRTESSEPVKQSGQITGYQTVVTDEGEPDKRLLVVEQEFAQVLRVLDREGNTLSTQIRQAWDTGDLRVMTKKQQKATGAHISIIGHIVSDELKRYLGSVETLNGFANRFIWILCRRSKSLPDGGNLTDETLIPLKDELRKAIAFAKDVGEMRRDADAQAYWVDAYSELTEDVTGLVGSITARGAPIVIRLSMIFALLDQSAVIRIEHLRAAHAVWNYAFTSARMIFDGAAESSVAGRILKALTDILPESMSKNDIRENVFHKNVSSEQISEALIFLLTNGMIRVNKVPTDGRPKEMFTAIPAPDGNGTSAATTPAVPDYVSVYSEAYELKTEQKLDTQSHQSLQRAFEACNRDITAFRRAVQAFFEDNYAAERGFPAALFAKQAQTLLVKARKKDEPLTNVIYDDY